MPDDTIASTVALTVSSVSGMPEFHEFQPIGGVSRCRAPESVAHPAMLAPAKLSAATIEYSRCAGAVSALRVSSRLHPRLWIRITTLVAILAKV
jgi:hypothetical protein